MLSYDDAIAGLVLSARERAQMSQADLAREMSKRGHDFRQQTIYTIESGKRRVTIGEAIDLAECMRLTIAELIYGETPDPLAQQIRAWSSHHGAFEQATREYAIALVALAETADRESSSDDVSTLLSAAVTEAIVRRTPSRVADARYFVEALLTTDEPRGRATRALLESVMRDHDRLGDPNG